MKAILFALLGISVAAGAVAQVPLLNSYPSARATLFLDFDGQYVTGTSWNWSGDINAQPAGLSTADITEVFNRVAEDYRIFNINITTDSTVYWAAPARQRMRLIITPTSQWYGSAGGISFVGSFTWGDGTPAWVFSALLGNSPKKIAEAASHEGGHTLGLQHQSYYSATCVKTEYNGGFGTGETSWAPIMGVGYYRNLTTWHYGTSVVGCSTYQDDISVIAGSANNFGLRPDDIGNTHVDATNVNFSATGFGTSGLINSATDKDVFKFSLASPTFVQLDAVPENVGANNSGANIDIKLSLLNNKGDTIGQYNPADVVSAGVDTSLATGTYYVVVEGVGNAYLAASESLGFYTLTASTSSTLPIHHLVLSGSGNAGTLTMNWLYESDEAIKQNDIQYSTDGAHFETLATVGADNRTFSYKPLTSGTMYYRIRVVTVGDEKSYYSNIITMRDQSDEKSPVRVMNNIVTNAIAVNADGTYNYQLMDGTGRLLQRGTLAGGANQVAITTTQKGMLLLRVQGASQGWTWKLIKQ